jgi:hypothetical protein
MAAKPKADVLDEATLSRIAKERVITGLQSMSRNSCAKSLAIKYVLGCCCI